MSLLLPVLRVFLVTLYLIVDLPDVFLQLLYPGLGGGRARREGGFGIVWIRRNLLGDVFWCNGEASECNFVWREFRRCIGYGVDGEFEQRQLLFPAIVEFCGVRT